MNKADLLQCIVAQLSHDLDVLYNAARAAHEAAIHSENIPDNKYDTLALEASYVAQGQANRASDIRQAIQVYKQLQNSSFSDGVVRIPALVILEDEEGMEKRVFMGPLEGGLKVSVDGREVVVITPGSPLGRELMGKTAGDMVEIEIGTKMAEFEITGVC